jgi:hypothetical protein
LEQRLRCLPAELFRQVFERVLPLLHGAWPPFATSGPAACAPSHRLGTSPLQPSPGL